MDIQFVQLSEVEKNEMLTLMNHPLVQRQMPLLAGGFSEKQYQAFLTAKEQIWVEYGYGPWAFLVDGQFVGWGGLQPENGEADLALVLHLDYWGIGKILYRKIIQRAFDEMGLPSVTVLFPPTRTRVQGLLRLGFKKEGVRIIGGEQFVCFRLEKPNAR